MNEWSSYASGPRWAGLKVFLFDAALEALAHDRLATPLVSVCRKDPALRGTELRLERWTRIAP